MAAPTNPPAAVLGTRSVQAVWAAQAALIALPTVPTVVQAASPTIAMVQAAAIAPTVLRQAQHRTTAAKLTGIQHLFPLLAALEAPVAIHGTAHFRLQHAAAVVAEVAVQLLSLHSAQSNILHSQPTAPMEVAAAQLHPVAAGVEAVAVSALLPHWK
jgi:hypothetical protein